MLAAVLDIGSRSVKLVLLRGGQIVHTAIADTGYVILHGAFFISYLRFWIF